MKFIFNVNERNAVGNLLENVGLELHQVALIIDGMEDCSTRVLTPEEFGFNQAISDEAMKEINEEYGHIMTITKTGEEYIVWLNDRFFCESMKLYNDGLVEIIRGVCGVIKTMKLFFITRVEPFFKKWNLG